MHVDGSATGAPAPASLAKATLSERVTAFTTRFAFLGVWLTMVVIFGLVNSKYFAWTTAKAIFSGEQALVFLGLSLVMTLVVGEIDLSGSAVLGLSATLVLVFNVVHHMNVVLASVITVAIATVIGAVNGFVIVKLKVSPFVVTLGMGTLIVGFAMAVSNQRSLAGLSKNFSKIAATRFLGLPLSFYYGAIGILVFTYILYRTPLGRRMQFVGANPAVARLAGVQVKRIKFLTFVVAGFINGLGGVIMIAGLGGFNASSSNVFLLPAIAASFLSTAVIDPGKYNPLGVFIAVYFLRSGVVGLQIVGIAEWVKSVFYGGALVVAVTASTLLQQRRSTV